MYTIVKAGSGGLETQVRQVVARRHREGRRLPEYILAPDLVGRAPMHVDGFLVMGSRMVAAGALCLVTFGERAGVRFEGTVN